MNNFDILPSPSDLLSLSCSDLSTCFQSIYNILFMILLGLAFFWFLFGAFEYLLSASGYYSIQKAKSRMISAILAVVIVLIIPSILYLIDPEIFKIKLKIPEVKVKAPEIYKTFENNPEALTGEIEIIRQENVIPYHSNKAIKNVAIPGLHELHHKIHPQIYDFIQKSIHYAQNNQAYIRDFRIDQIENATTRREQETACNLYVWRMLQTAGLLPKVCRWGGASEMNDLLKNHCVKLNNNEYLRWQEINFKKLLSEFGKNNLGIFIQPGDILVKEKPPNRKHGHVGTIVPVKSKDGKIAIALAHASYRNHDPRIQSDIRYYWDHIMRPIVSKVPCKK